MVCLDDFFGFNFQSDSDDKTRQTLWAARHQLYYSAIKLRDGATPQSTIVTDVCVPLSHFVNIINDTAEDVKKNGLVGPCFGHAGDGNFHCILPLTTNDSEEYK